MKILERKAKLLSTQPIPPFTVSSKVLEKVNLKKVKIYNKEYPLLKMNTSKRNHSIIKNQFCLGKAEM